MAAKAIVFIAAVTAVSVLATLLQFVLSDLILSSYSFEDPDTDGDARKLVAAAATAGFLPALGLALGFITRSAVWATAGAFAIFVLDFFVYALAGITFDELQEYTPLAVARSIGTGEELSLGVAIVIMIAWLALFFAGAGYLLQRRDA